MAKKHSTNEVPSKHIPLLERALCEAQNGFTDLKSMVVACHSLIVHYPHDEEDENFSSAINLLCQLSERADMLANTSDITTIRKLAEGGAA